MAVVVPISNPQTQKPAATDIQDLIKEASLIQRPLAREKFLETVVLMQIAELVRAGYEVNKQGGNGDLPLNRALKAGFPRKTIEFLLKEGKADPLLKDKEGNNAFFCTVDIEMWKLLQQYSGMDFQAVLNEKNQAGNTLPMHIVDSQEENVETLKALDYLIEQKARIPADISSDLLIQLAKSGMKIVSAEKLLKMGFPVNLCDSRSRTALHFALEKVQNYFAYLLISYGATVDEESWKVIYELFRYERVMDDPMAELASIILEKVDLRDFGWTSLHFAALTGRHEQLLKMLRDGSRYVHAPCDLKESTPLHLAANRGRILCMFYLITIGKADLFAKDSALEMPKPIFIHDPLHDLIHIYRYKEEDKKHEAIVNWVAKTLVFYENTLEGIKRDPKTYASAIQYYKDQIQELKIMGSMLQLPSKL